MPEKCKFNFNSIKVRLKPVEIERKQQETRFQFHKGTIKTQKLVNEGIIKERFQFHKGTIKTCVKAVASALFDISIP